MYEKKSRICSAVIPSIPGAFFFFRDWVARKSLIAVRGGPRSLSSRHGLSATAASALIARESGFVEGRSFGKNAEASISSQRMCCDYRPFAVKKLSAVLAILQ